MKKKIQHLKKLIASILEKIPFGVRVAINVLFSIFVIWQIQNRLNLIQSNPSMAIRIESEVSGESIDPNWLSVGQPVYLESKWQGATRLRKIGEMIGTGTEWDGESEKDVAVAYLELLPEEKDLLSQRVTVELFEFGIEFGLLKDILVSEARWREVAIDLDDLWAARSNVVIDKKLMPVGKAVLAKMEIEDHIENALVRFRDALSGDNGGLDDTIKDFARDFIDKLLAEEMREEVNAAIESSWDLLNDASPAVNNSKEKREVGLKTILERYFFVDELKGFSPEVTLLLRGIVYGSGGEGWGPERWVVLRSTESDDVVNQGKIRTARLVRVKQGKKEETEQ